MRTRTTKHQHLCILRSFIFATGLYLCTCVIGCAPLGTGSHPEPDYLYNSRSRSLQTPESIQPPHVSYEYSVVEYTPDTAESLNRFINIFAKEGWRLVYLLELEKENGRPILLILERQER